MRAEVSKVAGRRALTGLKRQRLGARSLSELVHVNRVEGLALGAGYVWRVPGDRMEVRGLGSYGFADKHGKGVVSVRAQDGIELSAYRQIRDIADAPVIAPLLNSLAAQGFGDDYGDYYRATGVRLAVRQSLGGRGEMRFIAAGERIASQTVHASPATGRYRRNPAIADGDYAAAAVTLHRRSEGFAVRHDFAGELTVEGGRRVQNGTSNYARISGVGHILAPIGGSRILARVQFGLATAAVPPHRAFVVGGRGTLLGDRFREWGGRRLALVHVEWRTPVPFLRLAAGPARTPGTITLAPYAAAGWADDAISPTPSTPSTPWRVTPGTRTTVGLGVEWLGVFRVEAGYGLQSHNAHVAFDVARDFWDIL